MAKGHPLAEYRRRLAADGAALPIVVNGVDIEFELRCGDQTLIATSYDYFDGSSHWIYLLRRDGKPIDQLSMPDQFGFLQNLEVISPTEIAFGFYGTHDRWNLVVQADGFWSFALRALLSRPGRLWFSKRRLALRQTKGGVRPEHVSSAAVEHGVSDRPASFTHLGR